DVAQMEAARDELVAARENEMQWVALADGNLPVAGQGV
ncbi:hypothetical protein A2U01_0107600, partial [Trifolium medium]|nr:hypothetical protein [Trifolium medium]